jgi:hypothetical protein
MVGIIPPEEGNLAVLEGEDVVITDCDPVGISAEVLQDPLGAIEGGFAIATPDQEWTHVSDRDGPTPKLHVFEFERRWAPVWRSILVLG